MIDEVRIVPEAMFTFMIFNQFGWYVGSDKSLVVRFTYGEGTLRRQGAVRSTLHKYVSAR